MEGSQRLWQGYAPPAPVLPWDELVPDAPQPWSPPSLCPGAPAARFGKPQILQIKPQISAIQLQSVRKGLAKEEPGLWSCPIPPLRALGAPPSRERAVGGTARQQPGRFVPVHIRACLMVGVCFFLLTLIIIVTPSIDTQAARRNNKECSVPIYSLSTG